MRARLRRISRFSIVSLYQRQHPKVLSVQVEQIKRDEDALAFSENEISKCRPAGFVEAGDLTIENGTV